MSEHQKDTEFLRRCIRYDESAERQELEKRITKIQRDERCVRRAVWLMILFIALAMAGLCYSAVFLEQYPQRTSQFLPRFTIKVFCGLGLGSLISLLAFVGLGAVYRKRLDKRREDCRQLAIKLFESRLGKPATTPLEENRAGDSKREKFQAAPGRNGSPDKVHSTARG
jgi:formate hydrogenlyase subunit 3/multisubunit Na+/H+ antiporter MnhD subunit